MEVIMLSKEEYQNIMNTQTSTQQTPGNITYIVDKALSLLMLEADLDTFLYEMQHMNK